MNRFNHVRNNNMISEMVKTIQIRYVDLARQTLLYYLQHNDSANNDTYTQKLRRYYD